MFPTRELLELVVQTIPMYAQRPELLLVVGVVLFLVHRQYRRVAAMEEHFFGRPKVSPEKRTAVALLYGLAGGALGTAIFLALGISLSDVGIWYVWPVAISLFLLHPRFLCFAYAGGLVSIVHLLTGWPEIHVPSLLALVAILHLVESILIWLHGADTPTPVYVRRPRGGVVGGFTLQKFWPLPFVAMMGFLFGGEIPAEDLLSMPDWWPLIASERPVPEGEQFIYILLPIVAALGYGDIAIARSPQAKARRTSATLLLYSLGLMGLALLAHHAPMAAWAAALFSPLAHEAVIEWGRRSEEGGHPLYARGENPRVLDVLPGSPAARLGLQPGDVIVQVNGTPVRSKTAMQTILLDAQAERFPRLSSTAGAEAAAAAGEWVIERAGRSLTMRWPGDTRLPVGVILVPEPFDAPLVDLTDRSRYARIVARLRGAWRRAS